MRYRIIKEVNDNDEFFYEVHFYEQVRTLIFFKRWKWVRSVETRYRIDFSYEVQRTFDTFEDAQKYVNKFVKKRTLESEGEIDIDTAYVP